MKSEASSLCCVLVVSGHSCVQRPGGAPVPDPQRPDPEPDRTDRRQTDAHVRVRVIAEIGSGRDRTGPLCRPRVRASQDRVPFLRLGRCGRGRSDEKKPALPILPLSQSSADCTGLHTAHWSLHRFLSCVDLSPFSLCLRQICILFSPQQHVR